MAGKRGIWPLGQMLKIRYHHSAQAVLNYKSNHYLEKIKNSGEYHIHQSSKSVRTHWLGSHYRDSRTLVFTKEH